MSSHLTKRLKNNITAVNISTVERASNVATIVTASAHGYTVGQRVKVNAIDNAYDDTQAVIASVPTTTSFTYDNTGADESAKSDAGTCKVWKKFFGQEIEPDTYYEIQKEEHDEWVQDPDIEAAISSGEIVVNDGTSDLSAGDGLNHYNANDATCIQGVYVDDAAKADGFALKYDSASSSIVYGSSGGLQDWHYAESETESSSTANSYQEKLKLTTGSLSAADYLIQWSAEIKTSNKDMLVKCEIDDTTLVNEVEHSEGSNGPEGTYSYYTTVGGFKRVNLSSGTHDIDIDYYRNSGGTAYIRRVRIMLWRVS